MAHSGPERVRDGCAFARTITYYTVIHSKQCFY